MQHFNASRLLQHFLSARTWESLADLDTLFSPHCFLKSWVIVCASHKTTIVIMSAWLGKLIYLELEFLIKYGAFLPCLILESYAISLNYIISLTSWYLNWKADHRIQTSKIINSKTFIIHSSNQCPWTVVKPSYRMTYLWWTCWKHQS